MSKVTRRRAGGETHDAAGGTSKSSLERQDQKTDFSKPLVYGIAWNNEGNY